jgi:LmbE family N-acetylglucosaminyl deacetylase
MSKNKNKILVVAAHPDDEALGCGGTIAKHTKDSDIYVVILGEGISSRYKQRDEVKKEELLELQRKSQKVSKLLGVKKNLFLNLPDNQFDTVPFLDIVKKVEEIVKEIKPEIIYTHHSGDLNIDHRITFQAVLTATRPIKKCPVREIYSFEITSSTEWSYQKVEKPFIPNIYEDISSTFKKKIKALQIYKTELRKFPHPRSLRGIKILAQKRGMEVGLKYAETFELIKLIR